MIGMKFLRQSLDLSADQFGKEILGGVSRAAISKWERGHEPIPKKKLKILSEKFGCKPELLQEEINDETAYYLYRIAKFFSEKSNSYSELSELNNQMLLEMHDYQNQMHELSKELFNILSVSNGDLLLVHMIKILHAVNEDMEHDFKSEKDAIAWHAMRLLS